MLPIKCASVDYFLYTSVVHLAFFWKTGFAYRITQHDYSIPAAHYGYIGPIVLFLTPTSSLILRPGGSSQIELVIIE